MYSSERDIKIERATKMNSVTVKIKDKVEIMVNVIPVTEKDDRIHSYKKYLRMTVLRISRFSTYPQKSMESWDALIDPISKIQES